MSILVIIIISIIKALFNVVRFDVQGRLAFFVLYIYIVIVLVDHIGRLISMHLFVFIAHFVVDMENDCNTFLWLLSLIFLLLSSMGVFVEVVFFFPRCYSNQHRSLLLLLLSCQLSFYTCSLQFRKTFHFFLSLLQSYR
jgi:hypothetical protein